MSAELIISNIQSENIKDVIYDALDQLRDAKSQPRTLIGFKTSKKKQ